MWVGRDARWQLCVLLLVALFAVPPASPSVRPPTGASPVARQDYGLMRLQGVSKGVMQLRGGKGMVKASPKRKARKSTKLDRDAMEDDNDPAVDDKEVAMSGGALVAATDTAADVDTETNLALPQGTVRIGDDLYRQVGGGVLRKPGLDIVGSGWKKTAGGTRERVTGIDWDTWRRKRKVKKEDFENSAVAPYEGSGPMLYQDVFGFSGKRVHRKVIRNSWDQMSLEDIKDKTERDAGAYLKALMLDADEQHQYAGGISATAPATDLGEKDRWKKDLFPQVKAMIDNEAKGLHFTGHLTREERDGKVLLMPTFTNETWRYVPARGIARTALAFD